MSPPTIARKHPRRRAVIAGGGVAGLETLLALRHLAPAHIGVTLLSPSGEFLYRPVTVGEPFRRSEARTFDLAPLLAEGLDDELILGTLVSVDVEAKLAITPNEKIPYDSLIVTSGARQEAAVPGALTFRGREDVAALQDLLAQLVDGHGRSIAFTVPSERTWPLPLYELGLMTAAHLREHGAGHVRVWLVTPEEEPLGLFGPAAAGALRPLLESRGIQLRTSSRPSRVRGGALVMAGGAEVQVDHVVALPALHGPHLEGLPADENGFIPVDAQGRVRGCRDVYAAGDVTAFPLKQGGLAAQEADAVAEALAAQVGIPLVPRPFRPVLRGLLMTGGSPLYLRAEPQRLPRYATVAIDAGPLRRGREDGSAAAGQPLWWPPAKVAGRYLSPFLSGTTAQPLMAGALLTDRRAAPGAPPAEQEYEDALELALLMAECDARWGDYAAALDALDAAEALQGSLPPEYEDKRRVWLSARMAG